MIYLKSILLLFGVGLYSMTSAQIEEGSITYEVELIDETSGRPMKDLYAEAKIDWQFNVVFSKNSSRVFEQYSQDYRTTYFHDKEVGSVLSLYESENDKNFSYSLAKDNCIKSLGHNYGDTVLVHTRETKEILGQRCEKVTLDLGGQAHATFWIAENISIGTIVPESPLAFDHLALEYTLSDGDVKTHFIATSLETKIQNNTVFDETIPEGFKLIVPIDVYDQNGVFAMPDSISDKEFNFVHYPKYAAGTDALFQLFENIPAYEASDEDYIIGENGEPYYLGPESIIIRLTVKKDGTISDVDVQLSPNEENKNAILKIVKKMPNWIPASVKGIAVDSQLSVMIKIPVIK